MQEWFQAVVLGVIQGLTEFLPISSSAHLRIFPELFGWGDPGAAFTAVVQIGTELAVILYFWHQIWAIITTWSRSLFRPELRGHQDARMGWYIIVGSIPIVVLGFLFQHQIETAARNLWLIATTLVVLGVVLGVADHVGKHVLPLKRLDLRHAILYGLAQACALIPGVSRSGATSQHGTVPGLRARGGDDLRVPAQPSRLCSAPACSSWPTPWAPMTPTAVRRSRSRRPSPSSSRCSRSRWLMHYISHHSYLPFVIYRIALRGAGVRAARHRRAVRLTASVHQPAGRPALAR